MNLVQLLLILLIIAFTIIFATRLVSKAKNEKIVIEYAPQQHPIYPFIQYDIREARPPSRRTYMRYPYYAKRYSMLMR